MDNQTGLNLRYATSPGALQWLVFHLLNRLPFQWETGPVHSGGVEGADKTRKGTPDIWGILKGNQTAYVQISTDVSLGKLEKDVKKCIDKLIGLNANKSAIIMAFMTYDPQHEEVFRCITLCNEIGATFKMYNNTLLCKLLDAPENQDLRKKHLSIPMDAEKAISSFERIHSSFRNLDFGAATEQLTDMIQMFDVNSNLEVIPDLKNPGNFTITPRKTEENPTGVIRTKIHFVVTDEIRKFASFGDFLKHLYYKQITAELIVQEVEQYSGEQLIKRTKTNNEFETEQIETVEFFSEQPIEIIVEKMDKEGAKLPDHIVIYPPSMSDPFLVNLEIDEIFIMMLSLQTKEINESENHIVFTVSNSHQTESPYIFEMVVSLPKKVNVENRLVQAQDVSFNFSQRKVPTAYQLYQYSDLLYLLTKSKKLTLINLSNGSELMSGNTVKIEATEKESMAERDFWKDVLYVERRLGHQFEIPEIIETSDIDNMYELIRNVRTGISVIKNVQLNLDFRKTEMNVEAHQLIRDSMKNRYSVRMQESEDYVITTLGKEFNFGKRLLVIPELKAINDKLDINGETVTVNCIANVLLLIIPEYYGTDDLLSILEKEGYKGPPILKVNIDQA